MLWVLLINVKAFLLFYSESLEGILALLGVLIGFVTILSGAPIGFLVSQLWYTYINTKKENYLFGPVGDACMILWRTIAGGLAEEKQPAKRDREKLIAMSVHITNSWPVQKDDFYLTRRWDLLNLIGSTGFALLLCWIPGLAIRLLVVEPTVGISRGWSNYTQLGLPFDIFAVMDILLLVVTGFLLLVLMVVYLRVRGEHLALLHFILWSYANSIHLKKRDRIEWYRRYFKSSVLSIDRTS